MENLSITTQFFSHCVTLNTNICGNNLNQIQLFSILEIVGERITRQICGYFRFGNNH